MSIYDLSTQKGRNEYVEAISQPPKKVPARATKKIYTIETDNFLYEVNNWQRKDMLYNVYVQKTSKLSGTYCGEASYSIGVKDPIENLERLDVTILTYSIY